MLISRVFTLEVLALQVLMLKVFGSEMLVLVPAALILGIFPLEKFVPGVLVSKVHLLEVATEKLDTRFIVEIVQTEGVVF